MTWGLLGLASREWPTFDGWAVGQLSGGDPLDLPLDRLLSMIYYWATRYASAEDRAKFDAKLHIPPKGREAAAGSPWSPEAETAALVAFGAQVGVDVSAGGSVSVNPRAAQ